MLAVQADLMLVVQADLMLAVQADLMLVGRLFWSHGAAAMKDRSAMVTFVKYFLHPIIPDKTA